MKIKSERDAWIDYLRVMAIASVVLGHTLVPYFNQFGKIDLTAWWILNFLATFLHFSVPAFVMISGSLLLGIEYTIIDFYINRASRLLIPFLFWSLFYVGFDFFINGGNTASLLYHLTSGFFIAGCTYFHLWFLSMFLCLMLFTPFINCLVTNKKLEGLDFLWLFFVILCFMIMNHISIVVSEIYDVHISWFKSFTWYVGYLILGYSLRVYSHKIPFSNLLTSFILILTIALGSYMSYWAASEHNIVKDYFMANDAGIFTFVISVCVFYLFSKNRNLFKKNSLVLRLSEISFGIYLIHPVFLRLAREYIPSHLQESSIFIPIAALLTFIISSLVLLVLRKISLIKYFY